MHSLLKLLILVGLAMPVPTGEWTAASPESQGISSEKRALARDFLAQQNTKAALVVRHGRIVAAWYWGGAGPGSEFLRRRLFDPIGIKHASFGFFKGRTEPSGYLHLSARDGARFGCLFLQNGRWNGRQIISSSWVQKVSRPSNEVNPHCSYLWWV